MTVIYGSLDLLEIETGSALERAAAPWVSSPLEAAQAMHREAHPMRPTQGQTAILEGKDDVPTVLIEPEGMRSEAHSERYMGAAQTGAIADRLLDHGHGRRSSFPSGLLGLAAVLHFPNPGQLYRVTISH